MNNFPIMPIRAKYADELTEGSPDKIKLDSLPVSLNVTDIKGLTTAQCNSLKCGDIVTKEDPTGKHAYVVTFKKDDTGMCLTYADGSGYIETVSYDLTHGEWVYNSTDVFNANKYGKVYNCVDATQLTLEQCNDIINGEYGFIRDDTFIYLIVIRKEDNLQFIAYDCEESVLYTYWYDSGYLVSNLINLSNLSELQLISGNAGDVLTIGENNNTVWRAPGTKLYRHSISGFSGYTSVITNGSSPLNVESLRALLQRGIDTNGNTILISAIFGYQGGSRKFAYCTFEPSTQTTTIYGKEDDSANPVPVILATYSSSDTITDIVTPL